METVQRSSLSRVAGTVLTEVALPLAAYALLRAVGASEAWALVAASVFSVLTASTQWVRRRRIGLLGAVILAGLLVSAVVAVVTDDPVVVFMVDPMTNVIVAALAIATLATTQPFVARIRRDLSPHPMEFDRAWSDSRRFRRAHRRASWIWIVGLLVLAAIWTTCVRVLPFDSAVAASRVSGVLGYAAMIGGSEVLIHKEGLR